MIISKFIDKNCKEDTNIIVAKFIQWCKSQDGTKLTKEQKRMIENVCHEHPIVTILCYAMQEIGYDSF